MRDTFLYLLGCFREALCQKTRYNLIKKQTRDDPLIEFIPHSNNEITEHLKINENLASNNIEQELFASTKTFKKNY